MQQIPTPGDSVGRASEHALNEHALNEQTTNPALLSAVIASTLTLWASAFPAIRVALRGGETGGGYSPEHIALGRYLVASLVLGIVAAARRQALPSRRDWPAIALMGFLGFSVYNVALNQGEVLISAGVASFIINTAPVWTLLLATVFLGERLSLWGWAGIALSFCGIGLLALGERHAQSAQDGLRGALLVLLAAVAASVYTILQKQFLKKYDALPLISSVIWAGTALLLVFSPGMIDAVRQASPRATMSIVYMGVFPAALAYVLWAWILVRVPISLAVSFIYVVPVLTTAISWLWLGETLSSRAFLGGIIALGGVVLVNTRGKVRG